MQWFLGRTGHVTPTWPHRELSRLIWDVTGAALIVYDLFTISMQARPRHGLCEPQTGLSEIPCSDRFACVVVLCAFWGAQFGGVT